MKSFTLYRCICTFMCIYAALEMRESQATLDEQKRMAEKDMQREVSYCVCVRARMCDLQIKVNSWGGGWYERMARNDDH